MRHRLIARLRDAKGFMLIEVMIAIVVLAIATTALTGVFVSAHLVLRRASKADAAQVLADQVLERFRAEHWDDIGLNDAAVQAADATYSGDPALQVSSTVPALNNDITSANAPAPPASPADATDTGGVATTCANASTLPVTCNPSRLIPDNTQSPPDVAPDHRNYRIDTYVTWDCPVTTGAGAETLGGTMAAPSCSVGSTVVPYAPVRVVTIVVRDATNLSSVVYRTTSTFDRLGGGSMPKATATPGGSSSGSGGSTSSGGAPSSPTILGIANGGGTGSAYIDLANVTSLSFDVTLPSSSVATDTVTLQVTDGTFTITKTASATQGSGLVHFTGVNGQALADGTITVTATSSNGSGSSTATTLTLTKDTVAPDAPTSVSLANGGGQSSAYVNIANKSSVSIAVGLDANSSSSDTVSVTLGDGSHTTGASTVPGMVGGGVATATGINGSSLSDGTVTATATVVDQAGNTSATKTGTFAKDTVAPTLGGISSQNKAGGTAKKAEAGDTVSLTFSEAILPSSVPATSNVTITTTSGNNKPVTLALPSVVASGGFQIGTSGNGGYLAKASAGASFTGSAVAQSAGNTKITVTLATCSGVCTDLLVGGTVSVTVGPASGLTDLAGNPVSSSTITTSLAFF